MQTRIGFEEPKQGKRSRDGGDLSSKLLMTGAQCMHYAGVLCKTQKAQTVVQGAETARWPHLWHDGGVRPGIKRSLLIPVTACGSVQTYLEWFLVHTQTIRGVGSGAQPERASSSSSGTLPTWITKRRQQPVRNTLIIVRKT
jgi:hypothetical protein